MFFRNVTNNIKNHENSNKGLSKNDVTFGLMKCENFGFLGGALWNCDKGWEGLTKNVMSQILIEIKAVKIGRLNFEVKIFYIGKIRFKGKYIKFYMHTN